jgi:tetratricopeptide (TPR) repeat protein
MALSTFLRGVTSIASVLPTSIYGLIALWQARSAVRSGSAGRAAAVAQRGIADLEAKEGVTSAPVGNARYSALNAALRALLATAQKRIDGQVQAAEQNFQIADSAFGKLLDSDEAVVAPFLSDYLFMLVEFGAGDRAIRVAENLSRVAQTVATQNQSGEPFTWLTAAMISPTPRMVMELGSLLLTQNNASAAFEAFIHSAGIALASNHPAIAEESIENALAIFPANQDAHRLRGLMRWRSGDFRGARQDFALIVASDPEDMEARVALSHAMLKLCEPNLALEHLDQVLKKDPDNVDAHWLLGEAELQIGEAQVSAEEANSHWDRAVASLTEALRRRPNHVASRRSRAVAYFRRQKPDEALCDLDKALCDLDEAVRTDPNDPTGHGWRSAVLLEQGKDADALSAVNVALALMGDAPELSARKAWLLGLKGRALLRTEWQEEALQALAEATALDSNNEDLAKILIEAYANRRDWKGLLECALRLQSNHYSNTFNSRLRREEIRSHRNLGEYKAAFDGLDREPRPPADDPWFIWFRARLLADIGDFEAAQDILPETAQKAEGAIDHLSLRGWVIQNLEARDSQDRVVLGKEGCHLYAAALESADRSAPANQPNVVWLQKGMANALLRSGSTAEATETYRQVIEKCDQSMKSSTASPLLLALIAWCYHCSEDYLKALRYYGASLDKGEQSIGVEFDYGLVLAASRRNAVAGGQCALDRYWSAITRSRGQNIFSHVGVLRVALHDVREILFRLPGLQYATEIRQLLYAELREALRVAPATPESFVKNVEAFLNLIGLELPAISKVEQEAHSLRVEASLLLMENSLRAAVKPLQEAADIYSRIDNNVWGPLTWRDLAFVFSRLEQAENAHEAACSALKTGIYAHDPDGGCALLATVTRHAVSTPDDTSVYQSLIRSAFTAVTPERAFLDVGTIVSRMSEEERALFARTVLNLYLDSYNEEWIWVRDREHKRKIPNNDRTWSPFRKFFPMARHAEAKQVVLMAR